MEGVFSTRPMRYDGERREAIALAPGEGIEEGAYAAALEAALEEGRSRGALLAYGLVTRAHEPALRALGFTSLGDAPALARPLRVSALARGLGLSPRVAEALPGPRLVAPFGGRRRAAVREITAPEPRVTRLWDRYSIDVGFAVERNARWVDGRVFERLSERGYRVFVFEDGERYVIRAMCVFRVEGARGYVAELLHDRTVTAMGAASHLLGLAVREMSACGAETIAAWSFPHSGSSPMYMRHAFLPLPRRSRHALVVLPLDPRVDIAARERHRWFLSGLDLPDV